MMFKSSAALGESTMRSLDKRLAALHSTNETWFDGTVGAVDRRIAEVRSALTGVRGLVAKDQGGDLVPLVASLEDSQRELDLMREALLEAPQDFVPKRTTSSDDYSLLPRHARQEIEVTSRTFLAENIDAAGDRGELAIRSDYAGKRLAERLTPSLEGRTLIAEAFVDAVQRRADALPEPQVQRVASAPSVDFADDLLFD